ncbi:MAG: cytochrome c oxidase accessory protein CcoG [Betaproteobacteria bacterium]|nr:cytochrome c oxidase accessory protein CcoG [Betaproteobacteria bacterium]
MPVRVVSAAPASSAGADESLFEIRRKIYPRAVTGFLASQRVLLVVLTQLAFYGTAWLEWNGRQAMLFDLAARKFYIFGFVFWPQDFIFLTGLLVIAALSLFLFTAIAGRLWCGYACPQTVYTELFMWIERKVEGDRMARIRLDGQPMSGRKLRLKATKHALWVLLAFWTGFTFVGYFTPIRELGASLVAFSLGPWETFWMLFYGFATWGNAGFMREQVCKYMCPYARFQSVMFDPDTLIVTYDTKRGEPRGSRGKSADPRASGLGDCVDCGICVQVCPTGIDIRNGLQYECIGCGACVDGCNQVMAKMGYPKGLIRYSTENAVAGRYDDRDILRHLLRPRTLLYSGLLLAVTVAVVAGIVLRTPVKMNIIRDRGNIVRELEDGRLENVYRVQIMNTREDARSFVLSVRGIDGVELVVRETQPIRVGSAGARIVPLELRVPAGSVKAGSTPVWLKVEATDDAGVAREEKTVFISR